VSTISKDRVAGGGEELEVNESVKLADSGGVALGKWGRISNIKHGN